MVGESRTWWGECAWGECAWTARDLYVEHAIVGLRAQTVSSLGNFDCAVRFGRSEWDHFAQELPNPANPELRGASPGLYITLALLALFLIGVLLLVGK